MTTRTPAVLLAALCLALPACSEDEPDTAQLPLDSSYLQSLEEDDTPPPPKPDPAADAEQTPVADEPEADSADPERELRAQRESRSSLGRTRDMARDTRNQLSGGASTDSRLADTGYDEHWIEVRDLHWDVPEAWTLAIPSNPRITGEAVVQSPLGNATVLFYEVPGDPAAALRDLGTTMLDELGSRQRPRTTRDTVAGRTVHRISVLTGTFVDPANRSAREQPFWGLRAAAIELDERTTAVVVLRGPEQTINQNDARWDGMIEGMTTK